MDATVAVSPNLALALQALKPEAMMQAAWRGMDNGMPLLLAAVRGKRLIGKGPYPVEAHKLGVKSSRLWQNAYTTPPKINGLEVQSAMGAPVRYAAAHEFGFSGTVKVEAHQRTLKTRRGKRLKVADRPTFPVKAHQRKVVIPERAPFRTGISEDMPILEQELARAISGAMNP